jgi:hypothetical protein
MKERNIKELLQLMLDNKYFFKEGLCYWKNELYLYDLITNKERVTLHDYIRNNKPSIFSSIEAFVSRNSGYYWECGDIKPRIKWLKKHINKIK